MSPSHVCTGGCDTACDEALTNASACMNKRARAARCARLPISECTCSSITNKCGLEASGCTCQLEI